MNLNNLSKHLITSEMEDVTNKGSGGMDDLMLDFPFAKKTIKHFRQIVPVQIHHFYIIDEIREVDAYINMINTLKTSEAHDTIFIYLNTPGGNLFTTLQIMAAIKQSPATVITCMEGQVASAGTMIFLSGHRHAVSPNTIFMAHNYSGGNLGKGFEMKTRQKFDDVYFNKFIKDTYAGFLTEEEINAIMEDRDVWLDADEVCKRLKDKLIVPPPQDDAQNLIAALLGGNNGEAPAGFNLVALTGDAPVSPAPAVPTPPKKRKKKVQPKPKQKTTKPKVANVEAE